MTLFLKLLTGIFKVLLFMFIQGNTQRKNRQVRERTRKRHQREESSNIAAELLIAALFNGGSQ